MKNGKRIKLIAVPYEQDLKGIDVLNTYTTHTEGYDLTYVQSDKGPEPIHIMQLKNAKLNEKIHIKTYQFEEDIEKLYDIRSDELQSFSPRKIRVLVNEEWEPKPQSKPNSVFKATITKIANDFNQQTGYEYAINLRRYFIDEWSPAQLIACIFGLLLKIQEDGSIRKPHLDEIDQIVSTFGSNYLDKGAYIPNILTEDVKFKKIEKAKRTQQEMVIDPEGNVKVEGAEETVISKDTVKENIDEVIPDGDSEELIN